MKCFVKIFMACFFLVKLNAQNGNLPAIGNWRQHLPFTQAQDLAASASHVFVATPYGICTINSNDNSINTYTKINGLTETSVSKITFNNAINSLVIAYANSNIDVLGSNGNVVNIDDIKRKNITADKTIYNFYNSNNLLFVSTGFGIVVMDLQRSETKDTWVLGTNGNYERVNNITIYNNNYYAATTNGLRFIATNANAIANGNNWQRLNGFEFGNIQNVVTLGNNLLIQRNDTLYSYNGTSSSFYYADGFRIENISITNNQTILTLNNLNGVAKVNTVNAAGAVTNSIIRPANIVAPRQALLQNNIMYVADNFKFVSTYNNTNFVKQFVVDGPVSTIQGQIIYANNNMYLSSGGVNNLWQYTYQGTGFYTFDNTSFTAINSFNTPLLDSVFDIHTLAFNNQTRKLYAGSYGGGLVEINTANNTRQLLKQNKLQPAIGDPTSYRVGGLAVDADGNTWVANYGGAQSLACIQPNGNILRFMHPFTFTDNALGNIVIDQYNQKWITVPKGGGVLCYSSGNNLNSNSDDSWKLYRTNIGQGNLSDNEITSIAVDKQGSIWVGTINGVNIIPCTGQVFSVQGCQAIQPIVKAGNFAGILLQNQNIQSIAVDGANNKWIATQNGVFLVSADGDRVLQQFTENNSPLPSNNVKTIAVHGETGEVFMGTILGLVSYRGNATDATEVFNNVLVYPNPVPKNYTGFVAIKGLAENAFVKIIDANGALVLQGIANGGTYTFKTKNYQGNNLATGIYTILLRSNLGTEKAVAKLAIIN